MCMPPRHPRPRCAARPAPAAAKAQARALRNYMQGHECFSAAPSEHFFASLADKFAKLGRFICNAWQRNLRSDADFSVTVAEKLWNR
jgi:hypothetical protein